MECKLITEKRHKENSTNLFQLRVSKNVLDDESIQPIHESILVNVIPQVYTHNTRARQSSKQLHANQANFLPTTRAPLFFGGTVWETLPYRFHDHFVTYQQPR